jgi:DNA polymerase epsilon subunit 3
VTTRHITSHFSLQPPPSKMPRKEPPPGPISAQAQQDLVSEGMENFELPKSLVTRIARSAVRLSSCRVHHCLTEPMQLPENVKLQKETVLSLIKGSTVFINYLGAHRLSRVF